MKLKPNIELVSIADDYVAVPVGDAASSFGGVVALSGAAYFLLNAMRREAKTEEELVFLLTSEYDIDEKTARQDVRSFVNNLVAMGLIEL